MTKAKTDSKCSSLVKLFEARIKERCFGTLKQWKFKRFFFLLFLSLYTAEINIFEIIFSPCVRSPVSALDHFSHNWSHTSYTFPVPAQMFHNHSVLDFCSCKYFNLQSGLFVICRKCETLGIWPMWHWTLLGVVCGQTWKICAVTNVRLWRLNVLTFISRPTVLKNLSPNLTDYSQDQIVRVRLRGSSKARASSLLAGVELHVQVAASQGGRHVATCSPLPWPAGWGRWGSGCGRTWPSRTSSGSSSSSSSSRPAWSSSIPTWSSTCAHSASQRRRWPWLTESFLQQTWSVRLSLGSSLTRLETSGFSCQASPWPAGLPVFYCCWSLPRRPRPRFPTPPSPAASSSQRPGTAARLLM